MKKLLLLPALLLFSSLAYAQPDEDPGSGGPGHDPVQQVPLDGGSALLLTTGVGLGLRKLQQLRAARRR